MGRNDYSHHTCCGCCYGNKGTKSNRVSHALCSIRPSTTAFEASRGSFALADKCATAPTHPCVGPDLSTEARGPVLQRERGRPAPPSALMRSQQHHRFPSACVRLPSTRQRHPTEPEKLPAGNGRGMVPVAPREGKGSSGAADPVTANLALG